MSVSDYPWFPMFVDLSDKNALVVGAGAIGGRRAKALTQFCAHVDVIAPEINLILESNAGVNIHRRRFEPGDLEGRDLVIAATDDPALNAAIAAECRVRGIPVNVASDHNLCDFYFPGTVVDGDIAVGVTASGRDHARAKAVTRRIRECLEAE